ncbi:MAG: hypothetical protein JWO31_106 [Phycisphaerales bacterium]|nr:hypothetical protein [Phycisphaerales bacterium]
MSLTTYTIRAAARRLTNRCPATGDPIDPAARWAVFQNSSALSPAAARRLAPGLADVLARIDPAAEPAGGERNLYAIAAAVPDRGTTLCPVTGRPVAPRAYEVASCPGSDVGSFLSVLAGQDEAPAMAAALHRTFKSTPVPRPAAPVPPPETDEQRVEREGRERERRLRQALETVAWTTDPSEAVTRVSLAKAEKMVEALRVLLA